MNSKRFLTPFMEMDFRDTETRALTYYYGRSASAAVIDEFGYGGWRDPINEELDKQRKLHPTKAIHSNEPWKAKAKRQGRQIRKSK